MHLTDFHYELPDSNIAIYPMPVRDHSKLLVFQSDITHANFYQLPEYLPSGSVLVRNDTKVIPARLFFQKKTGAWIEIFLLEPYQPQWIEIAMQAKEEVTWKCMIGNAKRWKNEPLSIRWKSDDKDYELSAHKMENDLVRFTWKSDKVFSELINNIGQIPLPPYLNREVEAKDRESYQTVYAQNEGAVAAPTAGLHFSETVFKQIHEKGIDIVSVTLHVSAGTFLPIKSDDVLAHKIHGEQMVITQSSIRKLMESKKIVAVGTTSARVLESLYWIGLKIYNQLNQPFNLFQNEPYSLKKTLTFKESLEVILKEMETKNAIQLNATTHLYIYPGYEFQAVDILITNFHQPQSTLLLLVSAFTGGRWKEIYDCALQCNYRFLSYGDSSLLFRNH